MPESRETVKLVPATERDFEEFTGERPRKTLRAFVAKVNNRIVGIGGFTYYGHQAVAFLNVTEEAKRYPITMIRLCRKMINEHPGHYFICAIKDQEEATATRFLEAVGFKFSQAYQGQEVFRWHKPQSR